MGCANKIAAHPGLVGEVVCWESCTNFAEVTVTEIWAGIDAGKAHHHCVVIDPDGRRLFSRRVANDESELLGLLGDVAALGDNVTWAVDLNAGGAALLISLLFNHDQRLLYIPGRVVHRASAMYRGEGKSDARDAAVIAYQARMRRDLQPLQERDEIAVDLQTLTARRADVAADRTRTINRLRAQLLEYFPALERAFDFSKFKGALTLLVALRTPAALRKIGASQLASLLQVKEVRFPRAVADKAIAAAESQHTSVPGERVAAEVVLRLVKALQALNTELAELDAQIADLFRQHEHAHVISSLPGVGPLLGAELIAVTGGDVASFGSPDRLAGVAGLAPAPRDSGRISGNLHRPRRYSRRLLRVFYTSSLVSTQHCTASRRYYSRKRAEGKRLTQAVLALAWRRVNVLWALLRDNRLYQP